MGDLETTVAAPFIHMHAAALSQMKLIFYYTQDKRWMGIDDAKKLIALATSLGYYLESENKEFTLSDTVSVDKIPLGFKPTDAIFANAAPADPLQGALHAIAEQTGREVKSIAAELPDLKKHYDNVISDEAATILLARKYQADIAKYRAGLLKAIENE